MTHYAEFLLETGTLKTIPTETTLEKASLLFLLWSHLTRARIRILLLGLRRRYRMELTRPFGQRAAV